MNNIIEAIISKDQSLGAPERRAELKEQVISAFVAGDTVGSLFELYVAVTILENRLRFVENRLRFAEKTIEQQAFEIADLQERILALEHGDNAALSASGEGK